MKPIITTVVTPAVTRDLVSLADVREQLQFKPNDTMQDAWLTKVISRASMQAERYCNRIFALQSYQDTFGIAENESYLRLSQAPVSVTSISVDGGAALDPTSYMVDQAAGLIYSIADLRAWAATESIVVSYQGGYPDIPDDVEKAALQLVVMEFRGRTRDPSIREEEAPGLGRRTYWVGPVPGQTLPLDIGSTLQPWRRGGIG